MCVQVFGWHLFISADTMGNSSPPYLTQAYVVNVIVIVIGPANPSRHSRCGAEGVRSPGSFGASFSRRHFTDWIEAPIWS